jgi:hypothetical protein
MVIGQFTHRTTPTSANIHTQFIYMIYIYSYVFSYQKWGLKENMICDVRSIYRRGDTARHGSDLDTRGMGPYGNDRTCDWDGVIIAERKKVRTRWQPGGRPGRLRPLIPFRPRPDPPRRVEG